MQPIFSSSFVSEHTDDFTLNSVSGVREKLLKLNSLISELKSGKLALLKEEEIKSRFINEFFGDVLGFNYGNSGNWQLREERKSIIDGTKPDAALGYFSVDDLKGDVRVVVEMKNLTTNLDKRQTRVGEARTPVEQAFGYVSKSGGNCKWVVVSNMNETRFYPSLDMSRCQVFYLTDLANERKVKELLFFFHKDRFVKKDSPAPTELLFECAKNTEVEVQKPKHVLEEMYHCIKGFDGFGFVDPNYIGKLYPFNILNEDVWHYKYRTLFTINPKIYHLLINVRVVDDDIQLTSELETELQSVSDAKAKLKYCFEFLNRCRINTIKAIRDYKSIADRNRNAFGFSLLHSFGCEEDEAINCDIDVTKQGKCDCLSCNYNKFELDKLLAKLKAARGNPNLSTLEYAYANYRLAIDSYKAPYLLYKEIDENSKGKQGLAIRYFLAKKNVQNLTKPLRSYAGADKELIWNDVKTVDLDKVIYDEIEFAVDRNVKNYLISVKEDELIYQVQDEMDDIFFQIERLKKYYDGQSKRPNTFEGIGDLEQSYMKLYHHIHRNFIVYENVRRFQYLAERMFHGLILSSQTPQSKLKTIPGFYICDAIQNIPSSNLREILDDVDLLQVTEEDQKDIVNKFDNFLKSYYALTFFGEPQVNPLMREHLGIFEFKEKIRRFASNFFVVLTRIPILNSSIEAIKKSLIHYIALEDELYWPDIVEFGKFLTKKGELFSVTELTEILSTAVNRYEKRINKFNKLIPVVCDVLCKYYPTYKISNELLTDTALVKCRSHHGEETNYRDVIALARILDPVCKDVLYKAFEVQLNKKFDWTFYEQLIEETDYSIKRLGYFAKYVRAVNGMKDNHTYRWGKSALTDVVFFEFILLMCTRGLNPKMKEFELLEKLNDFERWLLNPIKFDYERFNVEWVLEIKNTVLLRRLVGNKKVIKHLRATLKHDFNAELAESLNILSVSC